MNPHVRKKRQTLPTPHHLHLQSSGWWWKIKKNIICEYRNKKNFLFLDYFLAQNMNGHRQKMYEETWREVQYLPSGLNLTTLAAGVCHVNTGRKGFPQESEECVTSKWCGGRMGRKGSLTSSWVHSRIVAK